MQERHLFSISKQLIDSVNSLLYNGNARYTYGSYSFMEVELNEMKGTEDYYVTDYTIPGTEVTHRVVRIRKERPTPAGFPRAFARIKKAPLR